MKKPFVLSCAVVSLSCGQWVNAEQISSAAQALKNVLVEVENLEDEEEAKSFESIYNALKKSESLSQDEQAQAWVAQLKGMQEVDHAGSYSWEYAQLVEQMFLKMFPEPETWAMLSKELEAMARDGNLSTEVEKSLQLLAKVLDADKKGFEKLLYEEAEEKQKQSVISRLLSGNRSRNDAFSYLKNDYQSKYANLEMSLSAFKKSLKNVEQNTSSRSYVTLNVPSLVSYWGEDIAKPLLERVTVLMTTKRGNAENRVRIDFSDDKATLSMLTSMLKAKDGPITLYSRDLVDSQRDFELLKLMQPSLEKFSKYDKRDFAQTVFDLKVCSGDVEGAKRALKELTKSQNEEAKETLGNAPGLDPQLIALLLDKNSSSSLSIDPQNQKEKRKAYETLLQLLDEPESGKVWRLVNQYGLELGKSDEVLELFSKKFPDAQPKTLHEARVTEAIAKTYVSLDAVEKGRELRHLAIAVYEKELVDLLQKHGDVALESFPLSELANLYASEGRLAQALDDDENANEWYSKLFAMPQQLKVAEIKNGKTVLASFQSEVRRGIEAMIEMEALAKAQAAIVEQLELHKALEAKEQKPRRRYYGSYRSLSDRDSMGELLVKLYRKANRAEDIVWLMENFPYWDKKDLFQLDNRDLLVAFAWALNEMGKGDVAFAVLQQGFSEGKMLNYDPAYKLLLSLKNPQTPALLDELIKLNPFQERPVIWKAQLAIDAGDFVEAEKLARKGISIDPSDGEQGKDDRMQVYAVLAEALAGQGNEKDANFFREVVAAIRMGEDADTLFYAGLTKRALEQYNQSLEHFADAYCLQSRLAVYYAKMGENEKAEQHYQRAFELMPSSFGRIESHCLGCEGAFRGKVAQGIAERVFTKLIKENPKHPQTYYLMGYLEDSRDRADQALSYYKKAVELDPLYLNAWSKIVSSDAKPSDENLKLQEEASFQLLKLDPYGKEVSRRGNLSFRLKDAYAALKNAPSLSAPVEVVFPLKASAQRISREEEKVKNQGSSTSSGVQQDIRRVEESLNEKNEPRSVIWEDRFLRSLLDLYLSNLYR